MKLILKFADLSVLALVAAGALAFTSPSARAENPPPVENLDVIPVVKFQFKYPYPSPDGAQLAFQGNFDGRWQIYISNLETGEMRRAHVSSGDDTHAAWSPDGEKIAFTSNRDGNGEIYVLDLESGAAASITPHPGKDGHPRWSADGQWLVFNRTFDPNDSNGNTDAAIMRVRADGTALSVISDSPNIETFPSFSPDGEEVAFIEWISRDGSRPMGDVVVVNIASGERRNLTRSAKFDGYPVWGAGGDWIYFSTFESGDEGTLYRIDPSGERLEQLSEIGGRNEMRGVPSADEKTIFFNSTVDERTLIFRSDL